MPLSLTKKVSGHTQKVLQRSKNADILKKLRSDAELNNGWSWSRFSIYGNRKRLRLWLWLDFFVDLMLIDWFQWCGDLSQFLHWVVCVLSYEFWFRLAVWVIHGFLSYELRFFHHDVIWIAENDVDWLYRFECGLSWVVPFHEGVEQCVCVVSFAYLRLWEVNVCFLHPFIDWFWTHVELRKKTYDLRLIHWINNCDEKTVGGGRATTVLNIRMLNRCSETLQAYACPSPLHRIALHSLTAWYLRICSWWYYYYYCIKLFIIVNLLRTYNLQSRRW